MRLRIGLPIASAALQPNIRSAATFQVMMIPSRSRLTNASGALSSTSRVRASLWRSARSRCSAVPVSTPMRSSNREINNPTTTGVPTARSQRTTGLAGSWITSSTA